MPVSKSPETELSPLLTPKQVPDIRQKRTSTEDQGVEPAVADQAKSRLEGDNRRLVAALSGGAAQRLEAASVIATDDQWEVHDF